MELEELRGLVLSERESGRLVPLPPEVYENTHKVLSSLTRQVYATEDPFSDDARCLIEHVSSIRATLEDLFRIRSEKILLLAETQIEADVPDREEIRKMLPPEQEMYEDILLSIRRARSTLVGGSETPPHPAHTPDREDTATGVGPGPCYPDNRQPQFRYRAVRVLAGMDPFMGIDGRIYHLHEDDIVTIPERNADVLVERNIVLNINLNK